MTPVSDLAPAPGLCPPPFHRPAVPARRPRDGGARGTLTLHSTGGGGDHGHHNLASGFALTRDVGAH